ncbi:5-formyltetrahydrofolate cyclo-ligase [Neocloeon triangulifer]|uniref:5-formyltetrahydrofolate cyclo-ligase n=1 Tax=Neocloeon triangulifer TaxID=2078957 RepID=UPI00286EC8B8|nr:5-formyltetrahydrofolate cyclo-ligase [Neocloeon triangulifer]
MSSVQAAKRLLRKEMKNRLVAMSKEQILLQSEQLTEKLLANPIYKESNRIAIYLSMSEEVQTCGILKNIFSTGKHCFIPRYESVNNSMEMLRLHSMDDIQTLEVTKWDVRQPSEIDGRENALETGGLDLIIVPGLAFTISGQRLGRGKGYYDTFLKRCTSIQKDPPDTIALSFTEQIVESIPTEGHDFIIDSVIIP